MATRNLAAEQDALKQILESPDRQGSYIGTPGASIPDASAATQQLLREAVNTNVYGSGLGPRDVATGVAQNQAAATTEDLLSRPQAGTTGTTPAATATDTSYGLTDATEDIYSRYGLDEFKTKEQLEEEAIAAIQEQLAGIEGTYASRFAAADTEGAQRQARGEGLSFASGAQYTPFAEARTIEVEEYNRAITDALEADKAAEIATLNAQARGEAREDYQAQADRAITMADRYIDSLTEEYKLGQTDRQYLLNEAQTIADMTGEFGGSPTLEMLKWIETVNTTAADSARSDAYLTIAQEEAAKKGYATMTDDQGNVYEYDPSRPFNETATIIIPATPRSTGPAPYIAGAGQSVWDSVIDANGGDITAISNKRDAEGNLLYSDAQIKEVADRIDERFRYQIASADAGVDSRYEEVPTPTGDSTSGRTTTEDVPAFGDISGTFDYLSPQLNSANNWLSRLLNPYN